MVFAVPLRILLICLLHFCTCAVGADVDPKILMNIVKKFEDQLGNVGQYAVAFRVEKDKCLQDSDYPSKDLLKLVNDKLKPKAEPNQKGELIQKDEVYVSEDLIAAKSGQVEHSEFRLKNYLKDILKVKDKCVVYFTVNSPCLKTCLSNGKYNIKESLVLLQNYEGIKAFAFKIFWTHDKNDEQKVINRLKEIAAGLPYYQCEKNKAECVKK